MEIVYRCGVGAFRCVSGAGLLPSAQSAEEMPPIEDLTVARGSSSVNSTVPWAYVDGFLRMKQVYAVNRSI